MGVSGQRAEKVIYLAYHKSLCFADFVRQPDRTPELSSASTSTSSGSHPATPPHICAATMGKRRKLQNVIKVDLGGIPKSDKIIPVLVQQKSKDGRRLEQSVHNVPLPQDQPRPPTFNPSPAYEAAMDDAFPGSHDPSDEPNGPERVSPHFSLQGVY